MKINIKYPDIRKTLGFVLSLVMVLTACNSVLDDVDDLSNYPEEGTFNDSQTVNAYLSALYASTFSGWPVNFGDIADESGGIIPPDWVNEQNGTMKYWPYGTIRRVNIMLEEMQESTLTEDDDKSELIAQAKFIRAYLYFQMVYRHGGVPIITAPQSLDDDLFVARNSTAECFDFIVQDLDDAIAALPPTYRGSDYGRIDKAGAMAFKGRVLLYKASPQFNPDAPYSNSYWEDAYKANMEAKQFLDGNGFGLLGNYTDVFETEEHKENIITVVYQDPIKSNGRLEHSVRPLSESKNATGGDEPIWALAEAYPMKDGKQPGESPVYTYEVQQFWENRDPRFAATLVWNGAHYPLSGKTDRRQYTMSNIASSVDAFGYIVQGESFSTRTGLYCRKGIMEELPVELVTANDIDWPEMRYAEVLFNYAEAANETGNPGAFQVLKDIRARAGIEPGADGNYGLNPGMSREEMREAILHEKYIEMAFEGHRFWDLRRHRMLDRLDGMRKYGVMALKVNGRTYDQVIQEDLEAAKNYSLLPNDFYYEVVELITTGPEEMSMPDKYYFFPIQLSHIDLNPKLEQNVGWGGTFDPTL